MRSSGRRARRAVTAQVGAEGQPPHHVGQRQRARRRQFHAQGTALRLPAGQQRHLRRRRGHRRPIASRPDHRQGEHRHQRRRHDAGHRRDGGARTPAAEQHPGAGDDQCRHGPDRQVCRGGRGTVTMDTRHTQGEVDRGTQPVEEQRMAVAAVVDERAAIVADQGEGDRGRHQGEDADDPAADRPLSPPGRQRYRQQREHGHHEPRRGAIAAPPHRIDPPPRTDRVRARRRAPPASRGRRRASGASPTRPASNTGALAARPNC